MQLKFLLSGQCSMTTSTTTRAMKFEWQEKKGRNLLRDEKTKLSSSFLLLKWTLNWNQTREPSCFEIIYIDSLSLCFYIKFTQHTKYKEKKTNLSAASPRVNIKLNISLCCFIPASRHSISVRIWIPYSNLNLGRSFLSNIRTESFSLKSRLLEWESTWNLNNNATIT